VPTPPPCPPTAESSPPSWPAFSSETLARKWIFVTLFITMWKRPKQKKIIWGIIFQNVGKKVSNILYTLFYEWLSQICVSFFQSYHTGYIFIICSEMMKTKVLLNVPKNVKIVKKTRDL
jgi:hypothetical protein